MHRRPEYPAIMFGSVVRFGPGGASHHVPRGVAPVRTAGTHAYIASLFRWLRSPCPSGEAGVLLQHLPGVLRFVYRFDLQVSVLAIFVSGSGWLKA